MKTTFKIWKDNEEKQTITVEHAVLDTTDLEQAFEIYCNNNNYYLYDVINQLNVEVLRQE